MPGRAGPGLAVFRRRQSPAFRSLQAAGSSAGAASRPWLLPASLVPAALLAAARGPGRSGLLHGRSGGLACLKSARARGQEAGRA